MAKRRSQAVAGRPVEIRRAPSAPTAAPPAPVPLWEWPLLAALTLAPIGAGRLDELPAFCLDLLILLAALLRLTRGPTASPRLPPLVAPSAVVLAVWGLLSLVTSVYRQATLAAWVHWSTWLVLAVLCADVARRPRGWERITCALLIGSGYVVVRGMQEYLFAAFRQRLTSWRTFSTFLSPNLLAAYLESLILLTVAVCLRDRRRPVAILTGFLFALQVATLFATGSRGGLYALAVGLVAFAALAGLRRVRPTRLDLTRAAALLTVTLPLLAVASGPIIGRILRSQAAAGPAAAAGAGAEAHSNQFRVLTWRSTANMVRARPILGFGLGAWRYVHPRYAIGGYTRMAHQSYLQLASEIGIPGLLAFLALLGATGLALVRRDPRQRVMADGQGLMADSRSDPHQPSARPTAWVLPGLGAGIAAAAAHNLIDYSWYVYGTAATFWGLVGLAWGLSTNRTDETDGTDRTDPASRRTVTRLGALPRVGVALLLALAAWLGLAASFQARASGAVALLRGEGGSVTGLALLQEAESLAKTAKALDGLDADPWLVLGTVYRSTQRFSEAVEAYQAAARRAPTWSIPLFRLGETYVQSGDAAGAVAAYRAGLEQDPNSTQLLLALAKAQIALGQRDAARATYERLVAVSQGPAGTVTALEQMRDFRPADAHDFLGREDEQAGRTDAAMTHYAAAAELLQARRRDLLAGGAAMMQAAGQLVPDEEIRLWKLEIDVWRRLARLSTRTGNVGRAADARANAADAGKHPPPVPGLLAPVSQLIDSSWVGFAVMTRARSTDRMVGGVVGRETGAAIRHGP